MRSHSMLLEKQITRSTVVGCGASLLLSIHKNTLFGKWPAPLANRSAR
jgi:hypothetical protein